jgi:hypothetical protein
MVRTLWAVFAAVFADKTIAIYAELLGSFLNPRKSEQIHLDGSTGPLN